MHHYLMTHPRMQTTHPMLVLVQTKSLKISRMILTWISMKRDSYRVSWIRVSNLCVSVLSLWIAKIFEQYQSTQILVKYIYPVIQSMLFGQSFRCLCFTHGPSNKAFSRSTACQVACFSDRREQEKHWLCGHWQRKPDAGCLQFPPLMSWIWYLSSHRDIFPVKRSHLVLVRGRGRKAGEGRLFACSAVVTLRRFPG